MQRTLEADQGKPYSIIKKRLMHPVLYKELLLIAKKNRPELTIEEIVVMFKKMSDTGCSAAMLTNVIFDEFYENDEKFQEMFGFSLRVNNTSKIEINKLLVDIFSRFYGVGKIRFVEHDKYFFNSCKEASKHLLNKDFEDESQAVVALFDAGYALDGFSEDGKTCIKSREYKISCYVGTFNSVAREKFGVNNVTTYDELKNICDKNDIGVECKEFDIQQKLTGLLFENFNFWCNYYFKSHGLDCSLEIENINAVSNGYDSLKEEITRCINEGYSVTVSSGPKSDVQMHTEKALSWTKISNEKAGHIMKFKRFDKDGNIIVSSYGEEYIIPKEFYTDLLYRKIKVVNGVKETKHR